MAVRVEHAAGPRDVIDQRDLADGTLQLPFELPIDRAEPKEPTRTTPGLPTEGTEPVSATERN